MQLQRGFTRLFDVRLVDQAVLDPLQRVVRIFEHPGGLSRLRQTHFGEVAPDVAATGHARRNTGEQQPRAALFQPVLDLLQHVRRGDVHRLHAAEVQHHIAPRAQFRFECRVELVAGAKEQTALQLEQYGLVAALFQDCHFRCGAHALGEAAVAIGFVRDDGAADLLADEQRDGQQDAGARGRD